MAGDDGRHYYWARGFAQHNNLRWDTQHSYTLYSMTEGDTVSRVIFDAKIVLAGLDQTLTLGSGSLEVISSISLADPVIAHGVVCGATPADIPDPISPGNFGGPADRWLWYGQAPGPVTSNDAPFPTENIDATTTRYEYSPDWSLLMHGEGRSERKYVAGEQEHIYWTGRGQKVGPVGPDPQGTLNVYSTLYLSWAVLVYGTEIVT